MLSNLRKQILLICTLTMITLLVISCDSNDIGKDSNVIYNTESSFQQSGSSIANVGGNSEVLEKAVYKFQQFASSAGIPYQNDHYEILNDDGTYANVKITSQFRITEGSDWTEHETTIQCRKVGNEWQCDPILIMDTSQDEKQRQISAQESANAEATQFWQNIQDLIKVEVTGTPSLGAPYNNMGSRYLIVNVKITNNDSQPHSVCIRASSMANLPDSILGWAHNPISWWGIYVDDQLGECHFLINGNTTETIPVGIGGGGHGHWAGDPSPKGLNNVSDADFIQFCAQVDSVDDNSYVSILWKLNPSLECSK